MNKILFKSPDPADPGSYTEYWYDDETDSLTMNYVQEVGHILEQNQREAFANTHQKHRSEVMNKVASIPCNVLLKWKIEDGIDIFNRDHAEAVRRKLNDPEYAYLRTRRSKL